MVNECTLFFFVKKEKRASLVFSPSRFSLYTFDQFKKHLLTQHKIQGIQLPNVISDVQQTEEKPQTKKKKKYRKRKNKNKKDTSAYVQPMQPSAARDMGS
jgi:hypothetical protein